MEQGIVKLQAPNASGNQDYTISGFGTPTGCIVFSTAGGQDAFATHGAQSIGTYDGTNGQVISHGIQDGVAASAQTMRSDARDALVVFQKYDGTDRREASATFIDGGVRLNWDAPGQRPWVTVWMFKGATAIMADWNDPDSTQDVAKTITTTGVDPNLIFFAVTKQATLGGGIADAGISFGWAYDNGGTLENMCAGWAVDDADPVDCSAQIFDSTTGLGKRCGAVINAGGNPSPGIECTAMGTDDFEITTRDAGATNCGFVYLALELTEDVTTFAVTTPTSSGAWDPFDAGFTPQCLVMTGVRLTSFNNNVSGGVGTESFGLYVANDSSDTDTESGHMMVVEDGVTGAGIVQSESEQSSAFKMGNMSGGAEVIDIRATNPSFDASGVIFADGDFDEAGTAYTVLGLFIDQPTAGGSDTAIIVPMGPIR